LEGVGWRQPGLTRQENRDEEICGCRTAGRRLRNASLRRRVLRGAEQLTHKCSIVSKKPDGKTLIMLGTEGFKTKSAAESALKGMAECRA